jgi:glycosyltransferase involved in cell wall biosynthesis
MIKVGIIGTRGIPNRYGGFERFVELLVESPLWARHDVSFVVYGEDVCDYNKWTQVKTVGCQKSERPMVYYIRSCIAASEECDIVLCCGVGLSYFAVWPMLRGRVLVVNPDGCEWRRTKWSSLGRLLVRAMYWPALAAARHIVIDAEALREDFGRALGNKARYIAYQAPDPHLCALSASTRESLSLKKPYFLVIARLEPENNILMVIDGYKRSAISNIELLIVGGTSTTYYKQTLNEHSGNGVRFVGAIYDQLVLDELRSQCVAYLHGHSVGGTNPSLLEALATCGGQLLCHDNKYNREVGGSEASYFETSSVLSEQLRTLINGPSSKNRRQPVRDERFEPDFIAQRYLTLFEDIRVAG